MTREMFLEELEAALSDLDKEEIASIAAYYGEMIDDRIEAGMSEEDAVAAMESVETIAERVLAEAWDDDDAEEEAEDGEKQENVKEIRKSAENVSELVIHAAAQRVYVTTGETDEIVLRYRMEKGDIYELHEENGVLSLKHKINPIISYKPDLSKITAENFLDEIGKFVSGIDLSGMLNIGHVLTDPREIEVLLPNIFKGKLNVKTANERIKLEGVTCLNEIKVKTCNARITARHVVAQVLNANTVNARIAMSEVYARDGIDAATVNGSIIAENVTCDNSLQLKTVNGAVKTEAIGAENIEIQTRNASVSGTVRGNAQDYAVTVRTSNGKSNLDDSTEGEKQLVIRTSNASVNMEFIG